MEELLDDEKKEIALRMLRNGKAYRYKMEESAGVKPCAGKEHLWESISTRETVDFRQL